MPEGHTIHRRLACGAKPLGALLLDQSIVAGVGVVYAAEVLFRAGIPPTRQGRELDPDGWRALWTDLRALMREGAERGRTDIVHSAHARKRCGGRPPLRPICTAASPLNKAATH